MGAFFYYKLAKNIKMEDGIMIGKESEQKSITDFNTRTNHLSDDGKILNVPENKKGDMAAFVLFATNIDDSRRIGLVYERQESISKSIIKAFTFKIPTDFQDDVRELVKEELMLQCGFDVDISDIEYMGKSFVGNEFGSFCLQFAITVDKTKQNTKTSKDKTVMESSHFWAMNEEVQTFEDWMCQLILIKRFTSKSNGIIKSRSNEINIKP